MKDSIVRGFVVSVVLFVIYFVLLFACGYFRCGFVSDFGFFMLFFFFFPQLLYLVPIMIALQTRRLRRALLGVKMALAVEFIMNSALWVYLVGTETLG